MPNRRQILQQMLRGTAAGAFALSVRPWAHGGWQEAGAGAQRLTDRVGVVDAGGTNVTVFAGDEGLVLVDSGVAGSGDPLLAALNDFAADSNVHTLFNTHYHLDQTGNNALFAESGATIIAHDRTRQWMSTDYWLPDEGRYQKARPVTDWPTETFFNDGSIEAAAERIDYGHLVTAHTGGDIYVHFRNANVLAVGGVASPVNDPELDWISGGWIGGYVDAMDRLLEIADEETSIVPGSGPVMTTAGFRAEREMMEVVRQRLFTRVRAGEGPRDMLDGGALDGLDRTWNDPYKFLYSAARGLWGNHNKLDPNVV